MNTNIIARSRFPSIIVAALTALTVVAFARTYYLRFLFDLPPLNRAGHIHGLISTLWLVLHYTQARLIAAHRIALHKRLGIVTACVGLLLVVHGFGMVIDGVVAGRAPPGRDPLQFLAVPIGSLVLFSLFLGSALTLRKRREWHKRLMLLATFTLLLPAAGRIDTLIMVPLGLPRAVLGFWLTFAFVAWAWMHDWRKLGRVHAAYIIGGILLLASIPARRQFGMSEAWIPIANWLTS